MASKLKTIGRKTGFILVAATPGFLLWPAAAQNVTLPPACQKLGATKAGVDCALKELDRRIDDAKAKANAAKEQDACGQFLLKGVANKKWPQAEIVAQAGGKFTPQNVCEIARRRGFVRKAAPRSPE